MICFAKKDKIKAPFHRARKRNGTLLKAVLKLPMLPKSLLSAQNDKHSDLRISSDTVMAVAADSHRDFLIPEYHCPAVYPTTPGLASQGDELCYSFVPLDYIIY